MINRFFRISSLILLYFFTIQTNSWALAPFSFFDTIPEEIYLEIFSCLDTNHLSTASGVSSKWNRIATDYFLWKRVRNEIAEKRERYRLAKAIYLEIKEKNSDVAIDGEVNTKLIANDPIILSVLKDFLQEDFIKYVDVLLNIVKKTKGNPEFAIAGSNAITVLNSLDYMFIGFDFREVNIPFANLNGAVIESVSFKGADLSNVSFNNALFNNVDFSNCKREANDFDGVVLKTRNFTEDEIYKYLKSCTNLRDGKGCYALDKYKFFVKTNPDLKNLIKEPFVFFMTVEVLFLLVVEHANKKTKEKISITRSDIYKAYLKKIFYEKKKQISDLGYDLDLEDFWYYAETLAYRMHLDKKNSFSYFKKRKGDARISYWHSIFNNNEDFSESELRLYFQVLPLRVVDSEEYAFKHDSILEYLIVKHDLDEIEEISRIDSLVRETECLDLNV